MDDRIIPFGKHKGKPVEILASDKEYADWLVAQSWFKEKYVNIYNVLVQNFREPVDTPEHNKIQVRFLKLEYRLKLAYLLNNNFFEINSDKINKGLIRRLNTLNDGNKQNLFDVLTELVKRVNSKKYPVKLLHYSNPIFEQVDVSYSVQHGFDLEYNSEHRGQPKVSIGRINRLTLWIEIKPTVSDDFPAILRQMKASMPIDNRYSSEKRYYILLVGDYTGIGATKEEFIEYFHSQGYLIIFEHQIDDVTLPEYETDLRLDSELLELIKNNTDNNRVNGPIHPE